MSPPIRRAAIGDLPRIVEIYNHYVEQSVATFDTEPLSVEDRAVWFDTFGTERHQLFVLTDADVVIGYAYSGPFRPRAAYARSVETTIYLAPAVLGRGLGEALYGHLLTALDETDVHRAYGVVTLPNPASVGLHRRFGFAEVGRLTECGRKFDRWHDVAILERTAPPRS